MTPPTAAAAASCLSPQVLQLPWLTAVCFLLLLLLLVMGTLQAAAALQEDVRISLAERNSHLRGWAQGVDVTAGHMCDLTVSGLQAFRHR
jgi:hypothetical protein